MSVEDKSISFLLTKINDEFSVLEEKLRKKEEEIETLKHSFETLKSSFESKYISSFSLMEKIVNFRNVIKNIHNHTNNLLRPDTKDILYKTQHYIQEIKRNYKDLYNYLKFNDEELSDFSSNARFKFVNDYFRIQDFITTYYLIDDTLNNKFLNACKLGHINAAKWLLTIKREPSEEIIDIHQDNEHPFRMACQNGHLDVAQWLYSIGGLDIHASDKSGDRNAAFNWACYYNKLDVCKWLYELKGPEMHLEDNNYWVWNVSVLNANLEMCQWLYSLNIPVIKSSDSFYNGIYHSCCKGNLEMAKWFYNLIKSNSWFALYGEINFSQNKYSIIQNTINAKKLICAEWLINVSSFDFKSTSKYDIDTKEEIFENMLNFKNFNGIEWIIRTYANGDIKEIFSVEKVREIASKISKDEVNRFIESIGC